MKTIKHNQSFFIFCVPVSLLLYLLDSTGIMTLKIGTAHPVLLIPFLVAVAMAAREWVGLCFGAWIGVLLDITGAECYFFNFLILLFLGCACGLMCSYLVNDNIYSAMLLSFGISIFYFAAKWLLFFVIGGKADAFKYLISYSLPSAAYTALFIIPFYYLVKFISKKTCYFD